jgi:3-phenylpropionate/trans-cinnamate dioxygenase ferredoxin reductase subunit
MNVNIWDVLDDVKSLIRSRTPVDVDKLTDPKAPLADLLS